MEFKTEWTHRKTPITPTNSGDELLPQYIETIDKNGKTYLKKTSDKNVYEMIQEESKGTSIYEIVDKYLQTGDETLLNRREGVFADFLNLPKSQLELHQKIKEAEHQFEQLDREIRAEFDNDVGVFKTAILDGTFEDRIAHYIGKQTKAEKAAEVEAEMKTQKSEVKKSE